MRVPNSRSKVPALVRWHLLLCLSLTLAAGCGSRKDAPADKVSSGARATNRPVGLVVVGSNEKSIVEMLPEDVLVSVNGVDLKRKAFDAILERMERTFQAVQPNARVADVVNYRKKREKSLVGEFVTKQLLLQEARRRNLVPSPESKAKTEAILAKRAKMEKKTPDEYLRSVGKEVASEILADLEEQALILEIRKNEFGDRLTVTAEDLQKVRDLVAGYNRMCEATNALVKARGVAICERLRNGEDFATVANAVTEYRDEDGGVWGEFARAEIDDANVRNAAFTLPVGAVSDPIDTEEGLVIIKVFDRKGVDAAMAKISATVRLGRIVLLLGESKTVPDEATLRKELEQERLEKLQGDWLRSLRQQAHIEYPNGTNFWKTASKGK